MPIHVDDAQALERLRTDGSQEAAALAELTGITVGPDSSEAHVLHTLLVAGRLVMEQRAEEDGPRRLAEFLKNDPEHQAWRTSRQARRRARGGVV